jgi:hypothetical protein
MTNTHPALPPEVETLGQFLEQTYSTYDIPNHLIQTMNHIDIIELDQDFVPIKESWKPREVASWKKLTQGSGSWAAQTGSAGHRPRTLPRLCFGKEQ